MAGEIFNPDVPKEQPGQYIGWSRPISGYAGNKSQETLLKGLGTDIDEGAKVLNTAMKDHISDEVDRGISARRDAYKEDLQRVYQDISGQSQDLLPKSPDGSPPDHLQNQIGHNLETLQAARRTGKYSDTYIDMQYDDFLKEMRAKYPGYREWIDHSASESLGRGLPANRVIATLTGDINSYAAQVKQRKDAVDTKLAQTAADGDPEAFAAYKNRDNIPEDEKISLLNRKAQQTAKVARLKETRDSPSTDPGLKTSAAMAEANQRVSDSLTNFVHTFTMGGPNTEQLIRSIEDPNVKPEQKAQNMQQLQTAMNLFRQKQVAEFNKVDPRTGRSLDQDLGGRSVDIINKQMSFYSSFQRWMQDGSAGPVAATVNHVKAADNDPTSSLLKTDIHAYVDVLGRIMKDNPGGNDYLKGVTQNNIGITPTLKAAADSRRMVLAAGTDYNGRNSPLTINQVIQDAKNDVSSDRVGDANSRSFFNNVVGWYKDLFDKSNPSVQQNMARAFYGPGNEDVMKHFPPETKDTRGQLTVFNQWFSPAVDKEMFTTIARNDQGLLNSYTENKKAAFKMIMAAA